MRLDNYRPITLLNTIWEMWEYIFGNRLTPLLNLLTEEEQTAYKPNRSTLGFLSQIANEVTTSEQINSS